MGFICSPTARVKKPQCCFRQHFTDPMLGPLLKISLDLHTMEFLCLQMHIIVTFCMSSLSHAVHVTKMQKIHGMVALLPPRGQVWSGLSDREIDRKQSSKLCNLLHFYNRRVLAVKTGPGCNHRAFYLQKKGLFHHSVSCALFLSLFSLSFHFFV